MNIPSNYLYHLSSLEVLDLSDNYFTGKMACMLHTLFNSSSVTVRIGPAKVISNTRDLYLDNLCKVNSPTPTKRHWNIRLESSVPWNLKLLSLNGHMSRRNSSIFQSALVHLPELKYISLARNELTMLPDQFFGNNDILESSF